MHRTVLAWARPRRWSILAEAALATALALAALPVLAFGYGEPEPVEVVTAYLEALRDRDIERAEEFVSGEVTAGANRTWLTAEAMSSDWDIESVELKSASIWTVHVAISAGEHRAEGAFHLDGSEDEPRIADPYVYLSNVNPMFTSLNIGGLRGDLAASDSATSVALYPGSYRLFADTPDLGGEDGLPMLALPGSSTSGGYNLDATDFGATVTGPLTEDDDIESRLNGDLAAWLDDCAASADLAPAGCPFSAAYDYGVASDGIDQFSAVEELDWAVETYPRVRFDRALRLEVVEPGWITLTGKGTSVYEDGETDLNGRCRVDVTNIAVTIGEGGEFTLALAQDQSNSCV